MHNESRLIPLGYPVVNLCVGISLCVKTYQSQRKDDQHEYELYQQILHLKDPA